MAQERWQPEPTDFPPTVITVDSPPVESMQFAALPWAATLGVASAWHTAEEMSRNAERIASEFRGHRAGRAALFALVAELLAVGSVALALLPLIALSFPRAATRALFNPSYALLLGGEAVVGVVLMALLMVGLHALWAWGMELGVWNRGLPRNWNSGVALACYSCGWDLVTSPFGVCVLLFGKGPRSVGPVVRAALNAPRLCVNAYLQGAREFSEADQSAVLRFAVWVTAPVVLLLAGGLLVGLVAILA
ncbi:MAG TPA: hypothetical protein VL137_07830 [Polyangiaceae bacterium]|nr:hypothetical protein [Polyangiaceae bacterium]